MKHIPTPKQTTKDEFLKELEVFKHKLGWSYLFWVTQKQKPHPILDKPIFSKVAKKSFHFEKEFSKPLELTNLLEHTIDQFDEFNPVSTSSDPTKNLCDFLQSNPQVKIVASDKNLGMAAFDIEDYNEMVLTHLSSNNYLLINNDSTLAPPFNAAYTRTRSNLFKLIESLKSDGSVDTDTLKILKSFGKNAKPVLPCFHVLPKLHKMVKGNQIIPSRPIVGATNWYTTPISKLLSKKLRPIIKRQDHIATNTYDVTYALIQLNNFNQRLFEDPNRPILIITMDISSLYTNISLERLRILVQEKNPELEGLINFINDHNYFQYDGKTFKQKDGIAMGTNSAPEIANYYLLHLLDPAIIGKAQVKLYKRFLDDLLMLWNDTLEEFMIFFDYLNQLVPGISFTYKVSNEANEFLDLRIAISSFGNSKPKLSFSTHQKTLNKYAYISPKSCHPIHTLKGFIYGELQRYSTNSSSYFFYHSTKQLFMKRLLARGYSRSFLLPIFKKHKYFQRKPYQAPGPQLNMSLRYSYRSNLPFLAFRIKRAVRSYLPELIPETRFLISWKKSPNLFNKLCKSKLTVKQSKIISTRNSAVFAVSRRT